MGNTKEIRLIVLVFALIIAVGTFLLSLPFSVTKEISFIDALYTSTSATCVTGLIVKDTPNDFTLFGQCIILLLIQIGGLGYMAMATFLAVVLRKRLTHRDQMILKISMNYDTFSGVIRFLKISFLMVLSVELIGALLLAVRFAVDMPFLEALWFGLFHSLSFFNNAGFSLFSNSMIGYQTDIYITVVSTSMIIVGGIGYFVLLELYYFKTKRLTRISTHTKLTVVVTAVLIVLALLLFLTLEWNKSLSQFEAWEKLIVGYFYSVNLRTAGANSIDVGTVTDSTLFLSTIFMVIGGGVGGTAGGIKVTTIAVIVIVTWHAIKGHSDASVFRRTIPHQTVMQAFTILLVGTFYIILATILISETHDIRFIKIIFEVASAFGTVGLSVGNGGVLSLSANFNEFGKFVIILIMFAGRVGFLVFTLAFIGKIEEKRYKYAEGRIML